MHVCCFTFWVNFQAVLSRRRETTRSVSGLSKHIPAASVHTNSRHLLYKYSLNRNLGWFVPLSVAPGMGWGHFRPSAKSHFKNVQKHLLKVQTVVLGNFRGVWPQHNGRNSNWVGLSIPKRFVMFMAFFGIFGGYDLNIMGTIGASLVFWFQIGLTHFCSSNSLAWVAN